MLGATLSILVLLLAEISSLPTQDDKYYKKSILEIRSKSMGRPDPKVGEKLANWEPSQGNPSEQGSYFEGDILNPPRLTRNGLIDTNYRWPNAVIPYKIAGSFTSGQLNMINNAIAAYHQKTCIRFRLATSADVDYVSIESAATGCWSNLGRIGGKQTINLQTPGCLYYLGTVIHEMMHTAGFYHEQSRTDRDNYVTINWENITPGTASNFNTALSTYAYDVPYDYGSVLHYSRTAFSSNNKETITPKYATTATIGQRSYFSNGDINKLNAMYMCNGGVSYLR